jgi:hypothetical protein
MIVCQYNRDWLDEKTIDLYSRRGAETAEKIVLLGCSIAVSEAGHELFVFHFTPATYWSSHTSALSGKEKGECHFCFLIVTRTCKYSLRLCGSHSFWR